MTTPFQIAYDRMKALGLVLQQAPGQYRVNFTHGSHATEYVTDDLQDALKHGREMAQEAPPRPDPPLGPTRGTAYAKRRAIMYRHNNKIAKKRRERKA
jgi:hypothetical protein